MNIDLDLLESLDLSPNDYVYLYLLVNKKTVPPWYVEKGKLEILGYMRNIENETATQKSMDLFSAKEFTDLEMENPENWVSQYRNLFPAEVKTGGYSVRGTRSGCIKKLKSFMRKYDKISKEVILRATKKYVDEKSLQGYEYMKMADYFIEKEGVSMLESYIEKLEEEPICELKDFTNDI